MLQSILKTDGNQWRNLYFIKSSWLILTVRLSGVQKSRLRTNRTSLAELLNYQFQNFRKIKIAHFESVLRIFNQTEN